jgi:hypothetical protein
MLSSASIKRYRFSLALCLDSRWNCRLEFKYWKEEEEKSWRNVEFFALEALQEDEWYCRMSERSKTYHGLSRILKQRWVMQHSQVSLSKFNPHSFNPLDYAPPALSLPYLPTFASVRPCVRRGVWGSSHALRTIWDAARIKSPSLRFSTYH